MEPSRRIKSIHNKPSPINEPSDNATQPNSSSHHTNDRTTIHTIVPTSDSSHGDQQATLTSNGLQHTETRAAKQHQREKKLNEENRRMREKLANASGKDEKGLTPEEEEMRRQQREKSEQEKREREQKLKEENRRMREKLANASGKDEKGLTPDEEELCGDDAVLSGEEDAGDCSGSEVTRERWKTAIKSSTTDVGSSFYDVARMRVDAEKQRILQLISNNREDKFAAAKRSVLAKMEVISPASKSKLKDNTRQSVRRDLRARIEAEKRAQAVRLRQQALLAKDRLSKPK